ncbi:MAG TPA: matrixin family metalloprotease [Dehalococcoidia bacterium]|nr:matrixin family metalloprotease [Dehalococcoidia bacterium]
MRRLVLIGTILALLMSGGIAVAQGVDRFPANIIPSGEDILVPSEAIDHSDTLEAITIVHYLEGFGKPITECGNQICEPGEKKSCPSDCGGNGNGGGDKVPDCYKFMSKGAKLKNTEDLYIHPLVDLNVIGSSALEWDQNTSFSLFGSQTNDPEANFDPVLMPDGKNEFSFGNYTTSGVIAVARVWGYFSGPPQNREISQFDIMFDIDFVWGDAGMDPSVMDLQNIATHEIGHGLGLSDLYEDACSEVTMYGYSSEGEMNKRSLELADIAGLQELYGE